MFKLMKPVTHRAYITDETWQKVKELQSILGLSTPSEAVRFVLKTYLDQCIREQSEIQEKYKG